MAVFTYSNGVQNIVVKEFAGTFEVHVNNSIVFTSDEYAMAYSYANSLM